MTVMTFPFQTIRAAVASVAAELEKTREETRILFGPGFVTPPRHIEAVSTFVNPQTLADIQQSWGSEELEHAPE